MSAPDWRYWTLRDRVRCWQAAALSLGIDPYDIHRHPEYWDQHIGRPSFESSWFRSDAQMREFHKRCDLVDAFNKQITDSTVRTSFLILDETTLSGFARWAGLNDLEMSPEMVALAAKPIHDQGNSDKGVAPPLDVNPEQKRAGEVSAPVKGKNVGVVWQTEARRVADALHLRDKQAGAHSSKSDIGDRVATEFQRRGIEGPNGPLTGATIVREALGGGRWGRPKE